MALPEVDVGYDPSSLEWTYTNTRRLQSTARFHAERDLIGDRVFELLGAAKRLKVNGAANSINNALMAIRKSSIAIAHHCPDSTLPIDWAEALQQHLRDSSLAEHSRWSDFNHALPILREAARVRGITLNVRNSFSRTRSARLTLVADDARAILLKQAKADVLQFYRDFVDPDQSLADLIADARVIAEANGGTLPSSSAATGAWRDLVSRASERGVGVRTLHRLLYATPESLMPFFIVITDTLAANVDSVSTMRIDCSTTFENPFLGKRRMIKLDKPRSGDLKPYTVSGAGTLTVPWLVEAVLTMTKPLRGLVDDSQRELLFICATRQRRVRGLLSHLRVATYRLYALERCNLRGVRLSMLRPTRGVNEYKRTGDPFRAQRLLQHKNLATTLPYLDHSIAEGVDEALIADVQSTMLQAQKTMAKPLKANESMRPSMLPSHICIDPHDDRRELDEDGLCANLLWPLNDRHFIMALEPRPVAFLLRDYQSLCEAEKRLPTDRFVGRGYAARKKLMEDRYLPLIAGDLREAAEALICTLPGTPRID